MAEGEGRHAEEAESALVSAVVRVKGADGAVGGAGFLIAPDLVLTCAHVVSDALDRPRAYTVGAGAEVTVDLPLAGNAEDVDGGDHGAEVQRWIPIRADQTGDIAVLRLRSRIPGARPLPMADPERGVWDHDARAVGFTEDTPGGVWQSGRFRGPTRQGWIQLSRANGEAVHVKGGFSGSPVWDDELGAAVGMMVAAQPVREAQQAFVLRMRTLLKEAPELAPFVAPATPFRGLSTFQEDDADVFFGRDDDIERVVTAVRGEKPTVTVYGPSGCGKSSLALAGVVPRMRRDGYRILRVNAAHVASPRAALATELFEIARSAQDGPPRADSARQVESWLAELGLADAAHRALGSSAGRLLVVLDQAEALLDRAGAVTEETAGLLFPERQRDGIRVLVTLRADFVEAALTHPHLGTALKRGVTIPLTPMSREQLEEVISEPVKRVPAVEYDPGLERRILDDAGGEPGILPLLGFVLTQLWDHKAAGRLRTTTYEESEGVSGALRLHAEQAWKECVENNREGKEPGKSPSENKGEDEKEALRLLTGLVRVLPGGKAPLRRMLTREEAGETRWRIAESLAARRLLVLHGDEGEPQSVELAHEALISAWPTLAQQVRTDEEFLAGRAELEHDLTRWQRADRPPDLLPGSLQLLALHRRLHGREDELSPEEREFLDLARQHHRAWRNRVRAVWTTGVLVLALIAALGTSLVYQSRVSAERDADATSRALASISDGVAQADPGQAALAAIAAYDTAPTQEARSALLRRYDHFKDAAWALTGTEGRIEGVATSADATVALVTSGGARATLFIRRAGHQILRKQLRLRANAVAPMVSQDGRRIAYVSEKDGTVVWHDVRTTAKNPLGAAHELSGGGFDVAANGALRSPGGLADFSPDGSQVVAVATDGTLRLWDLDTNRTTRLPGRVPALEAVWFGPDENTLVGQRRDTTGKGTSIVSIDISKGKSRELADHVYTSPVSSVASLGLSADGGVLVSCSDKRGTTATYRAVRVADGRELRRYTPKGFNSCFHIAVHKAGERFAYDRGSESGEWTVVDTRSDKEAEPRSGPHFSSSGGARDIPLLDGPDGPLVVGWTKTEVSASTLKSGDSVLLPPMLLDDGKRMLATLAGRRGDVLALMDTTGRHKPVAEAKRDVTERSHWHRLAGNRSETLVADQVDRNRLEIREVPSLRRVAEITTLVPPPDEDVDFFEQLSFSFINDDELVTVSGGRIEHWNARDGRRMSRTIDLDDIQPTDQPPFLVNGQPEPGYAQVILDGDPTVRAIDLRTGKENKRLRIRLGRDAVSARLDRSRRYAVVTTEGSMMELWSVRPGERPRRLMGPFGPLDKEQGSSTYGFLGDSSEFVLANGDSVRFLRAESPSHSESYDFEGGQSFLDISQDGKMLLRTTGGGMDLFRLDPKLWKRHLCEVLGHGLTEDERSRLPSGMPRTICPA
ncbi:trypsin-like peptidase domain-containing protein [Streptomyces sp. NPDC042319]|uniref:nSTAND1 domain-containing NTPase n=1 Tax=Streptomyces sp. NPDC042319 TaxID=3154332 RepID=UPI0033F4D189